MRRAAGWGAVFASNSASRRRKKTREAARDWATQNLRERVGQLPQEEKETLLEHVREAARDYLSERQEELAQGEPRLGERLQRARQLREQRRSGEVKAVGIVKLDGVSQPHVIANIESEEDQRFIVDLGPVNKLRQTEVSPGTLITVMGIRARLNERPIILAKKIRGSDGRMRALDWQRESYGAEERRQLRGQPIGEGFEQ
jgi:hypothetical protein